VGDGIDARERAADELDVADVPPHVLGGRVEVRRTILVGEIVEQVEHADAMAGVDEPVDDVRADEPGSPGDEDPLGGHTRKRAGGSLQGAKLE
jgi:hypothetical protein